MLPGSVELIPTLFDVDFKVWEISGNRKIEKLTVQGQAYTGAAVCDVFYRSMTALKQCDMEQLRKDPYIYPHLLNYENIMDLQTAMAKILAMKSLISWC